MLAPKPGYVPGELEQDGWRKSSQVAVEDLDVKLSMNGFLDLRKIMDLTIKNDLTPTFKTFNVARSYGTKLNLTLECAGKTFLIYGSYNPCTLLAKQFDPDVPQYTQPTLPAVLSDQMDDSPPPYEAIEQRAAPSGSSQASEQGSRTNRRHHDAFGAGGVAAYAANASAAAVNDAASANAAAANAAAAGAAGAGGGGC